MMKDINENQNKMRGTKQKVEINLTRLLCILSRYTLNLGVGV